MPVLPSLADVYITIHDLEQDVIQKVENRTTDTANADRWIRDALLEISSNPDYRDSFDSLEVIGPLTTLTASVVGTIVQEYPFSQFLNTGDYVVNTLDVLLWTDYPTNNVRRRLHNSNFQDADRLQQSPSTPVEWYRFGGNIGFNPPPDKPYQVQMRIMRRHPINWQSLAGTQILLPPEWNEVIEWAAAMRGFMELLEFEKAGNIKTLLYGDPKNPGSPGLIESIKHRRVREAWLETQALRPVMRGYGYGSQ